MKKAFLIILAAIIIYGGGFGVMIGLPMYFTRNNKILELEKTSVSQHGSLTFLVNSTVSGEDLSLDLCYKGVRWCGLVRANITLNLAFSGWETKMRKACIIDNGYCALKLPSSFVTNEATLTSLEITPMEKPLTVESASLFIGKVL